jgi:hypothetical protein
MRNRPPGRDRAFDGSGHSTRAGLPASSRFITIRWCSEQMVSLLRAINAAVARPWMMHAPPVNTFVTPTRSRRATWCPYVSSKDARCSTKNRRSTDIRGASDQAKAPLGWSQIRPRLLKILILQGSVTATRSQRDRRAAGCRRYPCCRATPAPIAWALKPYRGVQFLELRSIACRFPFRQPARSGVTLATGIWPG